MTDEADFVGEQPINSLFTTEAYTDEEGEVDKHVIAEDQIQMDESLMIDTNLLTVNSLIRSGGQSVVYKGRYKGAPVALKLRNPDAGPEHNDKILREIRIRSQVKHENIVKFIGGAVHPVCVIVMEYVKSGSLKNYLYKIRSRGGVLELKRCISFALDISKAMECLHRNGIIHRDLKPDNLLVSDNHKKLKLGDFGLAREEIIDEKMTAGIGTLRWMAPELFGEGSLKHGEKIYYDHKVDIYSFSIVFWEMLTNSMPFEGMGNFQAAYAVKQRMLRPSLDKVPKEIAPLLASCWAADPTQRPEFSHITKALSEFLKTLNPSPSPLPRLVTIEEEEDGNGEGDRGGNGSGSGGGDGGGDGRGNDSGGEGDGGGDGRGNDSGGEGDGGGDGRGNESGGDGDRGGGGDGRGNNSGIGISQATAVDTVNDPMVQEVKSATIVNDTVVQEVKRATIVNDTAVKEVKCATIVNDTVVKEVKCATIANDTVVEEVKEIKAKVKANVDNYKSSLASKFCNFFRLCFSKNSSASKAN